MTIKRGDLVRHVPPQRYAPTPHSPDLDRHEVGIVLRVCEGGAKLILGDGLVFMVLVAHLETIPAYDGASIPASFPELVDGYAAVVGRREAQDAGFPV